MTHVRARSGLALLLLALVAAGAHAQPKEPARAAKVKVEGRYRIRSDRDERVRQYTDLFRFLKALGFEDARKDDPDYDLEIFDPAAERFTGAVPGDKVLRILDNARVQSILFAPADFALPEGDKPVAVKIGLKQGYARPTQQLLHRQVVAHLGQFGFVESLGYDTRGYALVRGAIPVKNLELLVKDVRTEPSGWFLPRVPPTELPAPLRDGSPIRWTEVLPVTEFPAPLSPPLLLPAQAKYSADLRAALADPAAMDRPLRIELIFQTPIGSADALRNSISRYAGAAIDGIIGNVGTVRVPRGAYVELLSQERGVIGVRLPRPATETTALGVGGKGSTPAEAVAAARLDALHRLGYTGAGTRVILIGTDFTGAEKLAGTDLPRRTTVVDLTAELSPDLRPFPTDPARVGTGVAAAKALAAAAPDVELVLVRIDPGSYFHLRTVVLLARGDTDTTDALRERLNELSARTTAFAVERQKAVDAYRDAFSDLSDNQVAEANRKKAREALQAVLVREKALTELSARFNAYQQSLSVLRGARVIVSPLVWESGYALDSLNALAEMIEREANVKPPRVAKVAAVGRPPLLWVQAASAGGPAVWGGPFLDANRDGLMEFAPPDAPLPADNWSHALNFLGTRPLSGDTRSDLAAGTKLRFVVQWREAADPNFPEADIPTHALTLRLLRQIDPSGEKRASDEMVEEARSARSPNVAYRTRTFLVYEQMLEYTIPADGRYALVVEAALGPDPLIPALRRDAEIYPRIAIETVGTGAGDPKVVFRSFTTPVAGVGTPGDVLSAVTVGAAAPGALVGGGTGLALRIKPDVFGPGALVYGGQSASGPGVATGFAGGAVVLLLQARASAPQVFASVGIPPGGRLELPEGLLKVLPPADKRRP